MYEAFFDIHGVSIRLGTHLERVIGDGLHDFFYFRHAPLCSTQLSIETYPSELRPRHWKRIWRGRRSELFWPGSRETRVRFFGDTSVSYEFRNGRARVYGDGTDRVYECVYFLILSFVGETLDRKGLHRVHGLGLDFSGQGILCLGASGTGKSSLALRLLNRPGVGLLSDDTPLLRRSEMWCFPQRIALRDDPPPGLLVRSFRRFEYGEKKVLGAEAFEDQVVRRTALSAVILMKRTTQSCSRFRVVSGVRFFFPLLRWLVIGEETPQIWELFLRFSRGDVFNKVAILVRRVATLMHVLVHARFYELQMSTSPDETAEALSAFSSRFSRDQPLRAPQQSLLTQRSSLNEVQI